MSGFTRDEVLSAARVLTQPDMLLQQRHWDQHADILAGRPVRFEAPGMRKDGSPFHLEVSAMPVTYRGEPHVLYAARDITDRKTPRPNASALEAQLRQAQKLEAIGTLAGGIAHDFNNILAAILGYGEMAQKESAEGTALRRHIDAAMSAGMRAKALVERILAFSRSGMGERVQVHVQSVVAEVLDHRRSVAAPRRNARAARLRPATPPCWAIRRSCTRS